MPISIYIRESFQNIDILCDEIWDLPSQLDALETWLDNIGMHLEPNDYVADIGFSMRADASGGGGVLSSKAMLILGRIGMDVYFSEYHLVK